MAQLEWWRDQPCPLHPSWGLQRRTELDLNKLKRTIDTDISNVTKLMVVENLIYRAFLEFHERGIFYNEKRMRKTEALSYLQEAEELCTNGAKWCDNPSAQVGYGIIINAFRLWMNPEDRSVESKLKSLVARKDEHPSHEAYILVTRAYIMSRLETRGRQECLVLYQRALTFYPMNCQWLFGKALIIGREAREARSLMGYYVPLSIDLREQFVKERDILRTVLDIDPEFHLARAYYAQSLFQIFKHDVNARKEMSAALTEDPQNRTICIIAARYYRRMGPFPVAEKILKEMLQRCNIAEVHSQLGYLYAHAARDLVKLHPQSDGSLTLNAERRRRDMLGRSLRLRQQALDHFNTAVDLNDSHTPSVTGQAEMNALLGDTATARDIYKDYLDHHDYRERPHLASSELKHLESALRHRPSRDPQNVFTPLEFVQMSHRMICVAIFLTMDKPASLRKSLTWRSIQNLEYFSSPQRRANNTRLVAKLKLGNAQFRLGRNVEAMELYKSMYAEERGTEFRAEIVWSLGKCYFQEGINAMNRGEQAEASWEKAMKMADELSGVEGKEEFSPDEISADIYLSKAKSAMGNHGQLLDHANGNCAETIGYLVKAVESGSLEAAHIYLTKIQNCRERMFSNEIPVVLANIVNICDLAISYHTDFDLNLPDSSKMVGQKDAQIKREIIRSKIQELLCYDLSNHTDLEKSDFSVIYTQLSDLRRNRIDFELQLLKARGKETWSCECKQALVATLRPAREVLDSAVSLCQKTFMEKPPKNSILDVQFDWKTGAVNPNKAETEVKKWARKKTFKGLPEEYPSRFNDILKKIIKIQPMYHHRNRWLAALGSFNTLFKHNRLDLDIGETFTLSFENEGVDPEHLKMRDIVEKSCMQVEDLVLYIVSQCREERRMNNTPDSSDTLPLTQREEGGATQNSQRAEE